MNSSLTFWINFLLLFAAIVVCDLKYGMHKVTSLGNPRPYSFSRSHVLEPVIPVISNNNLILLSLRSSTYSSVKTTKNKTVGLKNLLYR